MQEPDLTPIPAASSALDSPVPMSDEQLTPANYLGQIYRFKFHGQASEYFGIWIVNILLTIATLSLYAPWAKVRRLRYFYNNTEFFQRFFDFTGVPSKILVGRMIALSIWGIYAVLAYLELKIAAFGGLFIYLAMPWLVRATLRFTSRNSKFGNSRFYFEGTSKEAYKQFFISAGIILFTLGIFWPVAIWRYKRYTIDHLYVGQLKFKLNNDWGSYMSAVYVPLALFFVLMLVGGLMVALTMPVGIEAISGVLTSAIVMLYVFGILVIGPLIQARIFITTWNSTTLNTSKFSTECNQWRFAWIVGSNWIITILSLGLMSAWAAIRLYRYQVESLVLELQDDPNLMINIAQHDHSAIAEEISDIFDLDISL